MRLVSALLIAALSSFAHPARAAAPGPSFRCEHASRPMEHLICSSPALSQADQTLNDTYQVALSNAGAHRGDIVSLQRAWLWRATDICKVPAQGGAAVSLAAETTACLQQAFEAREKALRELAPPDSDHPLAPSSVTTWAVHDAMMALPYTPQTALAIFQGVDDGHWEQASKQEEADAAPWGEILALRYYTPASPAHLARMTALLKLTERSAGFDCSDNAAPDKSNWIALYQREHACQAPNYSGTDWIVARLGMSGDGLPLPCRLFAQHPELIKATTPQFGGQRDYFVPHAECDVTEYPWPASIRVLSDAVSPYDGEAFGRCNGSIRFSFWAEWRQQELIARVAPSRLIAASSHNPAGWSPDGSTPALPLEAWSYESIANRHAFLRVEPLFRRAIDDLAETYRSRFAFSQADAHQAAYVAVSQTVFWTFSNVPPDPLAVAIMRADATPDLATLLSGQASLPVLLEPLLSLAVDRPDAIRMLLDAYVPADQTNRFGKTPLMTAAQFDDGDTVGLLLRAGAAVDRQSLAPEDIPDNDIGPRNFSQDRCGDLQIEHGSRTALMYAAANASLTVIRQLLLAHADKALRDSTGLTALDYLEGRGPVAANPVLTSTERVEAARLLTLD